MLHPERRTIGLLLRAFEGLGGLHGPAGALWRYRLPHPIGEGGGRVVGRQRLTGGREVEDLLGIDALPLQLVELLGQVDRVLVAVAGVVNDSSFPDLEYAASRSSVGGGPARARSSGFTPTAARQTARSPRRAGVRTSS